MAHENDLLPPRYTNARRIGSGGMGEIFRAEDEVLGRTVAIKLLAERYARDESVRARFTREALAAARLSAEPSTITIFDVGEWNGRPFIVMEHLEGGSLEDRLKDGTAVERRGARLARAGCGGTGRRTPERRRPSRRQAREPAPRRGGRPARRRLRDRERGRHGLADDRRDRARHGRLPLTRAGSGRARRAGERPLRAGGRRLRAPHRTAPLRVGQRHGRSRGSRSRRDPARLRAARSGLPAGARQGAGRPIPDLGRARASAAGRARPGLAHDAQARARAPAVVRCRS